MFVQNLKEALSITTLFARSIMERIGFRSRDGIFYSAAALKKYLDKQPANSPDKPITVAVKANKFTLKKIIVAINRSRKYVNFNLSGSPLRVIPVRVFQNCGAIIGITIPDSATSIEKSAFSYCYRLASLTIPDSITSIKASAFRGCTSLTAIYVSSGNVAYTSDNGILYSKDKKTLVAYPLGKTETSFTIPDGVTSIGSCAFFGSNLASVKIPDGVTSIGSYAFAWSKSLASVKIPEGVTSIVDETFRWCTNLVSVTIPDSVTSIGFCAFYDCESLASVIIQGNVTSIGAGAFSCCTSLASITIPDSVISIGDLAFISCTSLASVTFQGTIPSSRFSSSDTFTGNLRGKFYAADPDNGTLGTYTRAAGGYTWTLQ